jgi:hypothetical protein
MIERNKFMNYKTRENIIIDVLVDKVRADEVVNAGLQQQITGLRIALLEIKKEAFSVANDPHCYENESFLTLCNMAGSALGHELMSIE